MNGILAMLVSACIVMVIGLATGFPALRRRGLILGLATLAVNLIIYWMVIQNVYFLNGTRILNRPSFFGISLTSDRAFYFYELVVLAVALAITARLRSGQLGRILGAMRDSEVGAVSVGINLRRYKLFIFGASAFMASIGGSLIAQQQQTFQVTGDAWSPLLSLFWFLAVVFAGLSYLSGALVGAVLFVGLDTWIGRSDAAVVIIAFLTLLTLGFMRGGLVGWLISVARGEGAARRMRDNFVEAMESGELAPYDEEAVLAHNGHGAYPNGAPYEPSEYARTLLERSEP